MVELPEWAEQHKANTEAALGDAYSAPNSQPEPMIDPTETNRSGSIPTSRRSPRPGAWARVPGRVVTAVAICRKCMAYRPRDGRSQDCPS